MAALWLALFVAAGADVFCAEWTERENSLVIEALQMRLEAREQKDQKASLVWLKNKSAEFYSSIKKGEVCDEAMLAIENLLACERYHYLWEIDSAARESKDFILNQYGKVDAWNQRHSPETRNEWYILSACEVINNAMPMFKYSKKISLGMEEKKLYDSFIAAKSKKGLLYLNAGLWYAFAPAIGGGSDAKAKEYFTTASKIGPSGYERFLGFVYLSQMDLKKGDKDSWQKHLADADSICPANVYTAFVRRVNGAGCDIFEYANDKDGVEAKVKKFYDK